MEGDLIIFFILFGAIFLVGFFSFIVSNGMAGKPWGQPAVLKRLGGAVPYKINEDKICKIYGYSEDEVEIKGCVELLKKEFLFKDLEGRGVIKIPYDQILNCAVSFSGNDLNSRSLWRLALPGWWRLPIPILGRRNYLRIQYKKNGLNEVLSFLYNDKTETFLYLKDLCKKIKELKT